MKIKVYQVNGELDSHRIKFTSYDSVLKEAGRIDPSIYKTVFDGDVDCVSLESVYELFNTNHPVTYQGHSLSVSDVVEVCEDQNGNVVPGFYFCDSIGYRSLAEFDDAKTEPMHGKKMVIVEPHKPAYEALVEDSLEALQRAVGGYIEITYPFDDNAMVIGNEEAKLIGMEGNRRVGGSVYAGPLLIAADDGEGGTTDLTDKQVDTTYMTVSETTECSSYAEIKEKLLELTYNTDKLDEYEAAPQEESDPSEYTLYTPEAAKKDDHIFSSVDIERTTGIFYSVYTFRATVNPQESDNEQLNGAVKLTITVNMPDKITQSKGGKTDGRTIVFDFDGLNETNEIAAVSEVNHYGVVIGIICGLIVIAAVFLFVIKRKK